MIIKKVPISEIDVWDKNPRNIKTEDFKRLKRQIEELGIYKPLLCFQEKGKYITLGGNMRLRALREMKFEEVDVSIVKPKSEAEKIKFALSDNDRAGQYDEDMLAELVFPHIEDIKLEDYKIDINEPWLDLKKIIERVGPDIDPNAEWQGMPEFGNTPKAVKTIFVHFETEQAIIDFAKLLKQTIGEKTKYVWFPKKERQDMKSKAFKNES